MTTKRNITKRAEWVALVTLASLFALSPVAKAQSTNLSTPRAAVAPKGQHGAMDPLQIMKQSLNLSDEQKKNLDPVLKEQRDKINALRRDTSLTRQQRMARLREMQQGRDSQIKAHLTSEQAEKWQKIRQSQRGAPGPQGPGSGSANSLSAGLQAQSAPKGLPSWRSRPQPQPHQPATPK